MVVSPFATHAPVYCWKRKFIRLPRRLIMNLSKAIVEFVRTLIGEKNLRKFWDNYPTNTTLVYICSRNGVTGVVRANDFDDEVRRMRKHGRVSPVRPQVYPVFIFSDKTPSKEDMRCGTLDDMEGFLKKCSVEYRDFQLPPLNKGELMPSGYLGLFEKVGYTPASKYRVYSFRDIEEYLHKGVLY